MRRAVPGHRVAHLRELGRAGERRMRCAVLVHGSARQRWTLRAPDLVEQVDVGAQRDAGRIERALQHLRRGEAEHLAIDRQRLAGAQGLHDPVDVVRRRGGGDLHEFDARAGEFPLGLPPVAAVGKERRAVERDDQRGHRPGEARQPFPPLPALRQVLRQVRIACGHQHGGQAVALQRVARALKAQSNRGGAGVHGGSRLRPLTPRRRGRAPARASHVEAVLHSRSPPPSPH